MINLGIIGTSFIAHEFIKASQLTGHYHFTALYSRKRESGQKFSEHYPQDIHIFTDLADLLASSAQVIYIASPNSLHVSQAKQVIAAKKHVIIEKPAVTRPEEWTELVKLAEKHGVYLFEAARNYHEQAWEAISHFLEKKQILGAHFSYAKYSSKMRDLLAGNTPNVFSNRFAGGALMDLGIYPIYAAMRLWGAPLDAYYQAKQLENSIDLNGSGQLLYPHFQVTIVTGKNVNSFLPSEIYTSEGTLVLDRIEAISSAIFHHLDGTKTSLSITPANHTLVEEAEHFASILQNGANHDYYHWLADAFSVHQTLYTMRQDAGITFEDQEHED